MKTLSLKTAGPFLLLTFIYFIVGFLTTVNGQCQGPLKVAFLSDAATMRNSLTTLVSFAFFLGYLLNSSRTGRMLNQIGYKRTLMRSLIVMVCGLLFYTASAFCAEYVPCEGVAIHGDFVPFGYFVFLVGSFLMGTAAAPSTRSAQPSRRSSCRASCSPVCRSTACRLRNSRCRSY